MDGMLCGEGVFYIFAFALVFIILSMGHRCMLEELFALHVDLVSMSHVYYHLMAARSSPSMDLYGRIAVILWMWLVLFASGYFSCAQGKW